MSEVKEKKPRAPKAAPKLRPALPRKPDGAYDWRSVVGEDNIILDRFYWAKNGKDVKDLDDSEVERLKKESPEEGITILLRGFRKLAEFRGVKAVDYELAHRSSEGATVVCRITLLPTDEEPYERVICGIASATVENCGKLFSHAEAIASNRASNRAWREYLNMVAISNEEYNPDEQPVVEKSNIPDIFNSLAKKLEQAGKTEADIPTIAEGNFDLSPKWNGTIQSLNPSEVMELISLLKSS